MASFTISVTVPYGSATPNAPAAPAGSTYSHVDDTFDDDPTNPTQTTYVFLYSDPHVLPLDGDMYTL